MKKYVREMIDDLLRKRSKDYVPTIPAASTDGAATTHNAALEPALPGDLNNQELSPNLQERVKQLDFQAQRNEERETIG